jgi:hypothetical protein
MLAGRPPFIGDHDAQLIGKQLFQQPAALQSLAPTVDSQLAAMVHRMLAKDTAARPAMRDVAAELLNLRQAGIRVPNEAQVSSVVAQTVHIADTRHTTLGQATGQLQKGSRLRPRHVVAAVGCVLVVGLGVLALTRGHRPLPVAAPPVTTVHWRIASEPPGAEVVAEPDGQVLGVTPLDYATPAAPGAQAVVLRQRGYVERRLLLSHSIDEARSEALVATPPPPVVAKAKPDKSPEPVKPPAAKSPAAAAHKPAAAGKRAPNLLRNDQVPLFR